MLINAKILHRYLKVRPKGILHVGAHLAEECSTYEELGWQDFGKTIWIEAQEELAKQLKRRLNQERNIVINAVVWDFSNQELDFKLSSNSQSSSLLDFGTHKNHYRDIEYIRKLRVRTLRLDDFIGQDQNIDFLNMDIQGSELRALVGLGDNIERVKWIYSEVNSEEVYINCTLVQDLDTYLNKAGFVRVFTVWTNCGWGDALYIKRQYLPNFLNLRLLAVRVSTNWRELRNFRRSLFKRFL